MHSQSCTRLDCLEFERLKPCPSRRWTLPTTVSACFGQSTSVSGKLSLTSRCFLPKMVAAYQRDQPNSREAATLERCCPTSNYKHFGEVEGRYVGYPTKSLKIELPTSADIFARISRSRKLRPTLLPRNSMISFFPHRATRGS